MHATVCDYIADIAQNAIEANARNVELRVSQQNHKLSVVVTDDGRGMSPQTLQKALDPFHTDGHKHPGRKVGLGLPFVKMAAEWCGGDFSIRSEEGKGTQVAFSFDETNVDMPPMGNWVDTAASLMNYPGSHDLRVIRRVDDREYEVSRHELREALGELETVGALSLMKQFLASNEDEVRHG